MSAFAILPIMFPQSGATDVDAGHEAMKGCINNSYDQSLARGMNRIPYKQRRVTNVNRTEQGSCPPICNGGFVTEALSGRNVGMADEVLAPNYVNRMTGADLAAFKGMLTGMRSALTDVRYDIDDLVAEGDAVVARWTMEATHTGSLMGESPTGKKISARGLTYYRLDNGQIVEDDPVSTPDLLQALGIQMPAQPGR